jgi:hypothetical protein
MAALMQRAGKVRRDGGFAAATLWIQYRDNWQADRLLCK